jgi:phosphotriesterase-related protein
VPQVQTVTGPVDTADLGQVLMHEHVFDTVIEMCRRGYAASMVLSQDASCYIDWVDPGVMAMLTQWRYTHIHEEVLPYLREHGVTDEQIETMLVANPRRYFENTGTY